MASAVDQTRVMLGTFAPQKDPYTYVMEEEETPSGVLARGSYTAKTKVSRQSPPYSPSYFSKEISLELLRSQIPKVVMVFV